MILSSNRFVDYGLKY